MNVQKDIYELIVAYLRKDISEEEMNRLRDWLSENVRHQELLEELQDKDVLQEDIGKYASFDTSRSWILLKEEMDKQPRKKRSLRNTWSSVAAVLVVAFVSAALYWRMTRSSQPEEKRVTIARIVPGRGACGFNH